eukprot:223732_1
MSVVRFSDVQSIIIEIQTCPTHRDHPIIIGMFDNEYHIQLNSNNNTDIHDIDIDIDIDSEYFISSISFNSSTTNKFRFAIKHISSQELVSNCLICGFKIGLTHETLLSEWEWYKTIRSKLNINNQWIIPILFDIGYSNKIDKYGLLLSINGISLDQIIKNNNNKLFTIETSMYILYKSIDCISYLHNINIIHSDIKYGNLTLINNSDIGLIDFDSTVFYNKLSKNQCGLDIDAFYPLRGTPLFASIDSHQRKLLTKRSDLISLLFSVLYGLDRKLLIWNKNDNINNIQKKKIKFLSCVHRYLNNNTLPKAFLNVFNYIINLEYHQHPNYKYVKNILKSWLNKMDKGTCLMQYETEFLNKLKDECYQEYQRNVKRMDVD